MAAHILFDDSYNAIQPTLVLATRSGNKIGIIPSDNVNFSEHLSTSNDLQFKVHKYDNGTECHIWEDITDFKLIWCPEWDQWFEINVEISESDETVKNISATSVGEAELSQINLYGIEINTESDIARDDYAPTVLCNKDNISVSLLHRILSKAPHYVVGHVDDSIKNIQRTFKFDGTSIYNAMLEIGEELNCLFIIDSGTNASGKISRTVNAYDLQSSCNTCGERGEFEDECPVCGGTDIQPGYGEDTNIFVSVENLADEVTFRSDVGSVKNCFRLVAGDDLMTAAIRNCNPNGSDYIWYFDEDIRNDMSDELREKLAEYDDSYAYYMLEHSASFDADIVSQYNAIVDKYNELIEDHGLNGGKQIPKIDNLIVGHPSLVTAYYNVIDFRVFLESGMMPTIDIAETSASQQAARLTSQSLSPVAVANKDVLSEATATSAVRSMAKIIVDSKYQVKVESKSFDNSSTTAIWTGIFTVTNYSDDEDTAETGIISVEISDDYEDFVRQKIENVLSGQSEDVTDISSLFDLGLQEFRDEIKKYCLKSLTSFYDACTACMDIMIENDISDATTWATQVANLYEVMYLPYYEKQQALAEEIKTRENEIAIIAGTFDEYDAVVTDGMMTLIYNEICSIQDSLNFEKYVGYELMQELSCYRREDTYENSNYVSDGLTNAEIVRNAVEFIKVANHELVKSATLQHTITSTLKNLLMMKEFKPLVDHFAIGNWIRIRVDERVYKLRLIGYEIDYDNPQNLSVEFSDVTRIHDSSTDIESILAKAASMATSYDSVQRQAYHGSTAKQSIEGWVSNGLALTKMKIVDSAENQNFQIDERGILCREYFPYLDAYDPKQLKIINRGLYLTDDAWLTSKAGIGDFIYYDPTDNQEKESYGVIADTLIGNLILSERVGVYNKSGAIKLDENGLTLISNENATTQQYDTSIFRVQRKSSTGTLTDVIYFDSDGNAHFSGTMTLGGLNNTYGVLHILDSNGDVVGAWDKDGIEAIISSDGSQKANFNANGFCLTLATGGTIRTAQRTIYDNGTQQIISGLVSNTTYSSSVNYGFNLFPDYFSINGIVHDESFSLNVSNEVTYFEHEDSFGDLVGMKIVPVSGIYGTDNLTVYFQGHAVDVEGDLYVRGSKNRVIKTEQYSDRLMYCYETSSPLFGDVGEGLIGEDGKCYIWLDPIFAQTISTDQYQVFLQRYGNGECYIAERNTNYFIVEGLPGLSFGWEIKAKQKDFDQRRLEKKTGKYRVPAQTYAHDASDYYERLNKGRISV